MKYANCCSVTDIAYGYQVDVSDALDVFPLVSDPGAHRLTELSRGMSSTEATT
jgi:hypothetical protein